MNSTNNIPWFDSKKFYLGKICKRGHEFHDTGKGLRIINRGECVECRKITNRTPKKFKPLPKDTIFIDNINYLGQLCKYNHEYKDTGLSLRNIKDRLCSKCRSLKSISYNKRNKESRNKYMREWRKKNPDKCKQYYEDFKQKHPETYNRCLKRNKTWSKRNPQQRLKNLRRWIKKNHNKLLEYHRQWSKENRRKFSESYICQLLVGAGIFESLSEARQCPEAIEEYKTFLLTYRLDKIYREKGEKFNARH